MKAPQSTARQSQAPVRRANEQKNAVQLSRRDLLKLLGGGIMVCVCAPRALAAQQRLPSSYVQIGKDGTVTILTGKVEFGQGIMTSLAQMAAEELDLPLAKMRVILGDTSICPVDTDGGTFGSLTTRNFGPPLRTAAARARAILVQLAAEQLNLPADQLMTRDGFVMSRVNESVRVSYAELAGGKNVVVNLTIPAFPKASAEFTISGKPALRLDAEDKVTGRAKYTGDIQVPGMLHARILRPPARGATLTTADTSGAEQIAGARVVRAGNLIAVLHAQPDMAERALKRIRAEYASPPSGPNDGNIHEYLLGIAPAGTASTKGNLTAGENLALIKVERTCYTPYVAHAPIEPHAALAAPEGAGITLWASTQTPFTTRSEAGATRVITPYIGGAFGGKIYNPQAREAVQLARAAGAPVNLAWTREEEFSYDTYQCPSIIRIRSGVNADGRITFWDYQVYWVGDRGAALLYEVPNSRIRVSGSYSDARPFAGGAWRAPGANANTFARESHMDALASAAGIDPVQFRLNHLQTAASARLRKTLEVARERFGWTPSKGPSGRGFGVACGEDAGSYVVTMAEVAVDQKTGEVKVQRMLCAQDLGRVINPEGARLQMESGMIMGMGYALSEELHFDSGRIQDVNFVTYALPRFSWMPRLETVMVDNSVTSPQGGGEPPVITQGAVLANAIFDATGARMNRLPMTPQRVLAEIKQSAPLALHGPERLGNQIRLTWQGGPGIKLQKCANLKHTVWEDVPGSDGASGVTLPATDAAAYFRLVKS